MNELDKLIADFTADIENLMELLARKKITWRQWEIQFGDLIAQYHAAAYMLGQNSPELVAAALAYVVDRVDAQLEYLSNFALVVQSSADFMDAWYSRAESYTRAIKDPYWKGKTQILPLPAMPAQGTRCMNNCGCSWRIEALDETAGDFDAYWERSLDDSCETCLQREADWNPVRIRGWRLMA